MSFRLDLPPTFADRLAELEDALQRARYSEQLARLGRIAADARDRIRCAHCAEQPFGDLF